MSDLVDDLTGTAVADAHDAVTGDARTAPRAPVGGAVGSGSTHRDLLVAELDVVRALVTGRDAAPARGRLAAVRAGAPGPGRLDEVAAAFGLSAFERATLLLACGPELVGAVADELRERTGHASPTFGAALALLPDAHWDALAPGSPLRHWELVRPRDADAVLASALVPDERVVHHLVGVDMVDARLALLSAPVEPPDVLPPTLAAVAEDVVRRLAAGSGTVAVALRGPQPRTTRLVAAAACAAAGLRPRVLAAADLPTGAADLALLLRRAARETALAHVGWVLDLEDASPGFASTVARALPPGSPLVVTVSTGPAAGSLDGLDVPVLRVPRLGVAERAATLHAALDRAGVPHVVPEEVAAAAGAFDLALPDVDAAAADVVAGHTVWAACRRRPRTDVGGLARVRTTRADWSRLVLPDEQLAQLRALVATVRHRATVLDAWGFAATSDRGRGTTALFAGDSGTGKTFAAEVIAHELALDLVHVDLSQVVDKYLGETEKRLARLFDAAEDGGVVLLFDEADALFGKRSEVKDAHDRYANVEVGYLLQRLEAFGGLAVLTTNARSALDVAFTRRLATVVAFPYPDRAARLRMWRQSLPVALPTSGLDLARVAEADLSGGGIAAAALQAAYLAAADGGVLTTEHLTQAVRWELGKSGRVAQRAATGTRRPA